MERVDAFLVLFLTEVGKNTCEKMLINISSDSIKNGMYGELGRNRAR